jgi:predicted DNA-binding ribbon-helix-helix protein
MRKKQEVKPATGKRVAEESKPDNKASSETGTFLVSRNLVVCGRRTTARLEDEMWASFKNIAKSEQCSVNDLASRIDRRRNSGQSLTSAIRLFLTLYYRDKATGTNYTKAGHDGEPGARQ